MDRRPLLFVGGAVALLASVYAIRHFMSDPVWRKKLGFAPTLGDNYGEDKIDATIEDSFPASDSPSYTPVAGVGR